MDNLLKHKVQRVKYPSKYTIPKKNNKLLVKKEEEEEERSNYQKFPKEKKKIERTSCRTRRGRKREQQAWSATRKRVERKLNAVAVIFRPPPVERRARVVGKSGEPVSRRQGRGEGSGVDEQFARERRLRLSAVGATLQLHRRGRDKLGVEDAGERKGKWRSGARQ